MPLTPASQERVIDLCRKAVALPQDSEDFESTIQELKTVIHEQLEEARIRLVKMALMVAGRNESQAVN